MQRSKDPEIFCIYLVAVTSIIDSKLHSSCSFFRGELRRDRGEG